MTGDKWEEVNLLWKFQLPSSYGLGVRGDMWHLKCDTWHLTCEIWHVTNDMCHVTHRGWWTLCKNSRSPSLMVWVWRCLEDSELKDDRLNQWMNNKGVCRTAPATPGLLKILKVLFLLLLAVWWVIGELFVTLNLLPRFAVLAQIWQWFYIVLCGKRKYTLYIQNSL